MTRLAYFPVIEAGFAFIPVDEDEDQHDRLEYRCRFQRGQPAHRSQGARRHQAAAQGTPGRLGSGRAERSLARAVRTSVEWRHARDCGQSRVPRQLAGRVRGLSRHRRPETLVRADAGRRDGGPITYRSMASNTWPSKWVGAAPSAWPRANWRAMRTWRRTFRACWCSSSVAKRSCPSFRRRSRRPLEPPPEIGDEATWTAGKAVYHYNCGVCHGDSAVSGGVIPGFAPLAHHA